jgi:hypothetical protein
MSGKVQEAQKWVDISREDTSIAQQIRGCVNTAEVEKVVVVNKEDAA